MVVVWLWELKFERGVVWLGGWEKGEGNGCYSQETEREREGHSGSPEAEPKVQILVH